MLPTKPKREFIDQILFYLFIFAILAWTFPSYAAATGATGANATSDIINLTSGASTITAETILVNISQQIPSLTRMVTAIAYVLGLYFVVMGVMQLREYGESRTMMSGQRSLKGPMVFTIVGALLIYLPTSVQVGMSTFWTNPNPYGYKTGTQQDQWLEFINVCFIIIQFVGAIAFIRGLVILSAMGGQGHHQGAFSKGITHIIGGIFCINIYETVNVILVTLGLHPY